MEHAYMVRGADGKEYGPVTLERLIAWIGEGRLTPQQQVRRNDMQHWAAAGDFVELQSAFTPPAAAAAPAASAPAPTGAAPAAFDPSNVVRMRSGASWFYWVAALSLINSIAVFSGGSWRFIIGLGVTQLFDALGSRMGTNGRIVALLLDLIAAGFLVLCGVFANKGHSWAFIVGIVVFALDGLLILLGHDWIGVAFHAYVLFCFVRGFVACRNLRG